MCKYCEDGEELISNRITATIVQCDNGTYIDGEYSAYSCDSSFNDEAIYINYCPMCGKKLTEVEV